MKSYCLNCRKGTENINRRVVKQCYYQSVQNAAVKKSRFIKNQEAKGLLSNLHLRTALSKVPLLVR